jgi:hypothetical protein
LKITNFKAINGYITRFVKRFDIKYESKSGESESVSEILVNEWKTKLIEKYSKYEPRNVWNIDETGLFWRLIQKKLIQCLKNRRKDLRKVKIE